MMRQMLWPLLCLLALSAQAEAASFECGKAVTKVEKLICSNDELSRLDERLSDAYKKSLQRTDIKQKAIDSQRQWLKKVRNPCATVECVKDAYETRVQEIELMSSFGIVILSAPQNKRVTPNIQSGVAVQPRNAPTKSDTVKQEIPDSTQSCTLPETKGLNREDGVLLLMEAVKAKAKLKQYACVAQGVELAHRIIQAMPDGTKRAEWGFELKDYVLPLIRSNEISSDEYEYRLLRAATQSVKDDWSPDLQASEDERFNDTAFLGRISDHYRKESQSGIFADSIAASKKLYPVDLAMLQMNFTLSESRRWAEPWRIENFFNNTNRKVYLDDMHRLWAGLPKAVREINQKKLSQGVLKATAGHVMSGYVLLSPDEAKKSIEVVRDLLAYVPQEPIGWQTHLYLAEANWQSGRKELAHDYFERARGTEAPYVSKGFQLLSMAKYLCSRMENGKFLQLCPYGIYSKDEMGKLLDEIEKMAETDSVVKYKIENVRAMRKNLLNGVGQ